MKKGLVIGITLVTTLSLTACGNFSKDSNASNKSSSSVSKKTHKTKSSSKSKKASSSSADIVSSSSSSKMASSSSSSASVTPIDWEEAASLLQNGGFSDFNYTNAKNFSDGSHQLDNGGFEMDTYPGAKGKDIFTLTPNSDGTVSITAIYGTLDGGSFHTFPENTYGIPSATVQR